MQYTKKVDKNDLAVRMALLKSYQGKCGLTDGPILDDLDIDHIIPASMKKEPDKLRAYLASLDLSEAFELDSLLNLIPVKRNRNRQKSNDLPSESWARFLLNRAAKMAPRVAKEIDNFRRLLTVGEAKEVIRDYLRQSGIDMEAYVEDLYNALLDDDMPFPEGRDQWDENGLSYYVMSTPAIRIEARLPTLKKPNGSCRIVFRSLRVRNATINLDHSHIVHGLLKGIYTSPVHNLRGFMVNGRRSDGGCQVALGQTLLPLKADELNELCSVVDHFGTEYIRSLREIDLALRAEEFTRSKQHPRGYRLVRVKKVLWERMVDFACRHDADEGNTPWHMFDSNRYFIKVFHSQKTSRYDDDFHMFFHPEPVSDDYPWEDDEVWVVGEVLTDPFGRGIITVDPRRYWDATTGFEWLTQEFIPTVITSYGLVPSKRFSMRRLLGSVSPRMMGALVSEHSLGDSLFGSGKQWVCTPPNNVKSVQELRRFTEYLQYHIHRPGKLYMTTEQVRNLYSAVELCLHRTDFGDYHYVRAKLPFEVKEKSAEAILNALRWHAEHDEGRVFSNLEVDCTLRCLVVALRDGRSHLSPIEAEQIACWLTPLYEWVLREQLLERACPDYPPEFEDWGEDEEGDADDLFAENQGDSSDDH